MHKTPKIPKMPRKNSGKRSINSARRKVVPTLKKPSKSKFHIKSDSQKTIKKSISKKSVPKKNVSKRILHEKKSGIINSKQKKETQKQKNEKPEIAPAGHGLEIQKLEEEFNNLKALLKEKRKAGVDTFVDEMKLFTIPPKIQLLKIEFYVKTYDDVSSMLSEVRVSLESAKPDPTILDLPVVDEGEKNPFEHLHKEESALPLSEDAKNYREELGKKRISISQIKESFSNLFRKRGGK